MKKCFRIARSPTAGRGVFATRPIKRDELIGKAKCVPTTNRDGAYLVVSDETGIWAKMTGPMRFLNHRRPANAWFGEDNRITATRRIREGEELFLDYGRGNEPEKGR